MSKKIFLIYKRKSCVRPTILGWVVILVVIAIVFRLSLVGIYYYLAINKPVNSKTLVLEGWVPTYAVKDAIAYYHENDYDRIIVTGIPIVNYEFISPYKSTAEATILALKHYGYNDTVYVADIPTNIVIDRTYNTAVTVRMLFDENNNWPQNFDIYTVGVHARRSRFMFKKVFGSNFDIGVITHDDRTFDPRHWWKNSKGFRNVSNEFVATLYVMLFFHPDIIYCENKIIEGKYVDSIYYSREDKHIEFSDSTTSPFNKLEREEFHGFNYFKPDLDYKILANFTLDTTGSEFGMRTTTTRMPTYRTYGYLDFVINDTNCRLTTFQNMDYKDDPVYGGNLFVPFKDLTNMHGSYGAGRYIDITIPTKGTVVLDFNVAYNPYCAYSERWSCPLVPFDNHLDVNIPVGEKTYK